MLEKIKKLHLVSRLFHLSVVLLLGWVFFGGIAFELDQNSDGVFSVSDVYAWGLTVFFAPTDMLFTTESGLISALNGLLAFFELGDAGIFYVKLFWSLWCWFFISATSLGIFYTKDFVEQTNHG